MKVRTPERRDAIVNAAARLFQEFGYDGASMNELVRRMGGSKATLYGYFPSKEALFSAVVRSFATSHLTKATNDLAAPATRKASVEQRLVNFAEGVLEVLTSDSTALAFARMVIGEAGRTDVGRIFTEAGPRETMAALSRLVAEMMDAGELRRCDPTLAANQLMALITAENNSRFYERDPKPIAAAERKRMARDAVSTYLNGMGAISQAR